MNDDCQRGSGYQNLRIVFLYDGSKFPWAWLIVLPVSMSEISTQEFGVDKEYLIVVVKRLGRCHDEHHGLQYYPACHVSPRIRFCRQETRESLNVHISKKG